MLNIRFANQKGAQFLIVNFLNIQNHGKQDPNSFQSKQKLTYNAINKSTAYLLAFKLTYQN